MEPARPDPVRARPAALLVDAARRSLTVPLLLLLQEGEARCPAAARHCRPAPLDETTRPLSFISILPKNFPSCNYMHVLQPHNESKQEIQTEMNAKETMYGPIVPKIYVTANYNKPNEAATNTEFMKHKLITNKSVLSPSVQAEINKIKIISNEKIQLTSLINQKRIKKVPSSSATPIHLLKSGHTYHSLDKLEGDQLTAVSNALKNIGDPIKNKGRTYIDAATKTRIKYKVVYPEDLKVSGISKIAIKDENEANDDINVVKDNVTAAIPEKTTENKDNGLIDSNEYSDVTKMSIPVKATQRAKRKNSSTPEPDLFEKCKDEVAVKVTRSGRQVKTPKEQELEDITRPKKKIVDVLTCLQCKSKFQGAKKIGRHYETYPSHKIDVTNTNLFDCFVDILHKGTAEQKCHTFIAQLEELIIQLRNMLPCMINSTESPGVQMCSISENIGSLLNLTPGKYNLNVNEAIICARDGHCKHVHKTINISGHSELNKPSQIWLSKHNEEIATLASEESDCARTYSVDKWPSLKKRLQKYYPESYVAYTPQTELKCQDPTINDTLNITNNDDTLQCGDIITVTESIESNVSNAWIVTKDTKVSNTYVSNESILQVPLQSAIPVLNVESMERQENKIEPNSLPLQPVQISKENIEKTESKPLNNYQYHSTHFQIRSSPIKSSTTTFNKIQIKSEDLPLFIKLTEQDSMEGLTINELNNQKVTNINQTNIDINGMFTDLKSTTSLINEQDLHLQIKSAEGSDNFKNTQPVNLNIQEHSVQMNCMLPSIVSSSCNSNFCNISQNTLRHNDRLLSCGNAVPDALNHLSVNENTMETPRMGLQLLDQLGNDCLSFTDSEFRGPALDLPLDLFPFHNPE